METGQGWRLGHRPALDGVRGIAVLFVLLAHAGFLPMAGGAFGVTVFFVLSGFLITRVITEVRGAGRWSYRTFIANRAVRLVPALMLMVGTISAVLLALGRDPGEVARYAAAAMLYVENVIHLWFDGRVFTHTWSLAVEEQFYLVWPFALLLVTRARRPWVLLAPVIVLSVVVRVMFWDLPLALPYSGPWSNAYALLLGCTLAVYAPRLPGAPASATPAALVGLVGLAAVGPLVPSGDIFLSVPAAGLAALLVWSAATRADGLTMPPLRFLGRISYAAYLWHWPLLYLTGNGHSGGVGAAWVLVASLLVATVSTVLIEEPILRSWRGRRSVRRRPGSIGAVELLQQQPNDAVVLPREGLDLGGDLSVRR